MGYHIVSLHTRKQAYFQQHLCWLHFYQGWKLIVDLAAFSQQGSKYQGICQYYPRMRHHFFWVDSRYSWARWRIRRKLGVSVHSFCMPRDLTRISGKSREDRWNRCSGRWKRRRKYHKAQKCEGASGNRKKVATGSCSWGLWSSQKCYPWSYFLVLWVYLLSVWEQPYRGY